MTGYALFNVDDNNNYIYTNWLFMETKQILPCVFCIILMLNDSNTCNVPDHKKTQQGE